MLSPTPFAWPLKSAAGCIVHCRARVLAATARFPVSPDLLVIEVHHVPFREGIYVSVVVIHFDVTICLRV